MAFNQASRGCVILHNDPSLLNLFPMAALSQGSRLPVSPGRSALKKDSSPLMPFDDSDWRLQTTSSVTGGVRQREKLQYGPSARCW